MLKKHPCTEKSEICCACTLAILPCVQKSKMSCATIHRLVQYFVHDLTATQTSKLLGIQRKTVNKWYTYFRNIILWKAYKTHHIWKDYLLGITCSQVAIKSILIPYTELSDTCLEALKNIREHTALPHLWPPHTQCKALIDTQRCIYYQLYNCDQDNRYALSFRSYCKRRLIKFNGIQPHAGLLHIKESEFRFNCQLTNKDMHQELYILLAHNRKTATLD